MEYETKDFIKFLKVGCELYLSKGLDNRYMKALIDDAREAIQNEERDNQLNQIEDDEQEK